MSGWPSGKKTANILMRKGKDWRRNFRNALKNHMNREMKSARIWERWDMSLNESEIIMYQSEDGTTKIDVRMIDETVWLSLDQMAELFQRDKSTISKHIKNIFEEGELLPEATVAKYATVQKEGSRFVERQIEFFNLDVIISVGYRVKSLRGTQFRIWATERLREYIVKGFTMNDDLLKKAGGGNYWRELLDRIRDIRSNEKVFYRQLLDLYATSVDYDPKADQSILFFKIVQNKMHFAAHGHTASEIIANRADSEKPFMGLTAFDGEFPKRKEIEIAKNYLTEEELSVLNRLVSAFFDLAELKAMNRQPMYMQDWITELDRFSDLYGKGVLKDAGSVSHEEALEKARAEFEKYQSVTEDLPTRAEKDYLDNLKKTQKKLKGKEETKKGDGV